GRSGPKDSDRAATRSRLTTAAHAQADHAEAASVKGDVISPPPRKSRRLRLRAVSRTPSASAVPGPRVRLRLAEDKSVRLGKCGGTLRDSGGWVRGGSAGH